MALISVIIPTCHRDDLLARCLERLEPGKQNGMALGSYEVIVTDDGRASQSKAMLEARYPWAHWVEGPHRGPAANRNGGAQMGRGEWLAFVDDDGLPSPDWLKALSEAMASGAPDVVEGRTVCPGKRDTPFEEHVENLEGNLFWSCNLAVRSEVFMRLEGFDEAFLEAGGEDMEFAWRIQRERLRTRFEPRFLVEHPPRPMTCRKIWRRVFMIRWILLYRLRINDGLPLDANPLLVTGELIASRVMELLRTTVHLVTKRPADGWRRQLFFQGLKGLTFPLVLPYLILWEFRFRRQLRSSR